MNTRNIFYAVGGAMCLLGMGLLIVPKQLSMNIAGAVLLPGGAVVGLMFTHAPAIARRELASYFVSPIAYILIAAYLAVVAFFFNAGIQSSGRAQMEQTFVIMTWMSLFICPIITMRLLSEEARSGTLETMVTAPITDFELAIGKYAGALVFYLALQAPTLVFVYVLGRQGSPDYYTILASYIGIILFGAFLLSIGLLISAFTPNQVISAFVGFVSMFLIFFLGIMGGNITGAAGKVVGYMGAATHYVDFTRGVINSQHVLYYVTLSVFFLFLTVRAIESRKWR